MYARIPLTLLLLACDATIPEAPADEVDDGVTLPCDDPPTLDDLVLEVQVLADGEPCEVCPPTGLSYNGLVTNQCGRPAELARSNGCPVTGVLHPADQEPADGDLSMPCTDGYEVFVLRRGQTRTTPVAFWAIDDVPQPPPVLEPDTGYLLTVTFRFDDEARTPPRTVDYTFRTTP